MRATAEQLAERRRLYDQGLHDGQIAAAQGVDRTAIRHWRKRNGLVARIPRVAIADPDGRRALYERGLSDGEIAELQGVNRSAIQYWRRHNGLPPNVRTAPRPAVRRPIAPAITPLSHPVHAAIARAVGRSVARDVADDAISEMWVALLEGRIGEGDIARVAGRFRNRAIGDYASKFGPWSLDAVMTEDGGRWVDYLPDHRAAAWLEDAGATVS